MSTEKEKMLAGRPYVANDDVLTAERLVAKGLLHRLNTLGPTERDEERRLLRELLGGTGEHFHIEMPFKCDYGYNIHLGENFYSNFNLVILDCAPVRIGRNVFIGPNVGLYTAGHPVHPGPRNRQIEYAFPVTIGDDVWIGGSTVVTPGACVGSGSVVGAGSVVTRDVPDRVVAAGNPCRVLRPVTDEDEAFYFKRLPFA